MGQGMLHRLIEVLMSVASRLGAACECRDYERVAILVHRIMSYQSRQFHTLEHVFGFMEGADAETALAAIFHDLVYFQVDDGLPPDLATLLETCLRHEKEALFVAEDLPSEEALDLCLDVFGFARGRKLDPFGGLNEFLSALAMTRLIGNHIPRRTLMAVVACIEASIPFRKRGPDGRGPADLLAARLNAAAAARPALGLGNTDVDAMVKRAVAFGNADVRDFALADASVFLSNTWRLLPESNASLRHGGAFTIREYRVALQKMRGFFTHLDPASVYHDYAGFPDAATMKALEEGSRRNIEAGDLYIKAKLLAVASIEAAAFISGGDAPMPLFMGDVPSDGGHMETLASHLPPCPAPAWIDEDNAMYRLLRDGRLGSTSFDLRNSPLALHFYNRLEPRVWAERAAAAELFFQEAGKPAEAEERATAAAERFLDGFAPDVRREFIEACACMVPTRRERFEAWLASRS